MARDCPDIETLAAYIEHKLTPEELPPIEGHLAECMACRRILVLTFNNSALIEEVSSNKPKHKRQT